MVVNDYKRMGVLDFTAKSIWDVAWCFRQSSLVCYKVLVALDTRALDDN